MTAMSAARVPVLGMTAAAAAMMGGTSMAAEWTLTPSAQLSTAAQDNPRLAYDDEDKEDEISAGAVASFQVRRRTEHLELTSNSRAAFRRYQRDTDLDRSEQHVDVTANWQGELVGWKGAVIGTRDRTTTSELGETGLTQFNERHEGLEVTLGPSWQASERMSVRSELGWELNEYPDPLSQLSDYRYTTASVSGVYAWSDRVTVSLIGSGGRYKRDDSDSATKNASVRAQVQYAWSPVWTISGGIGPSWAEANGRRERGFVYNAAIQRRFELSSLALTASRSQSPSGFGVLTELDSAGLDFGTQLGERLSASLGASYVRRRDALPVFGLSLQQELRYTHVHAGLNWLFARNWRVGLSVVNRAQQAISLFSDRTAKGYEAGLTLSWNGDAHVY